MKRVIVIGATSGIGRELAEIFAGNGYMVGITGRRTEKLEELKSLRPDVYLVKAFDVRDTDTVAGHLEDLIAELGGLDLLVISSGTGDLNAGLNFKVEKNTVDTNVLGFTCIADKAFEYFEKQQYGHLVAITSVAGIRGSRLASSYAATKAYQINYLEGLRMRAKHLKMPVYVTDIRPGFVDTAMAKGEGLFWVAPIKKAAGQIFRAVVSRKKVAYITKRWLVIGFILKWLPRCIYERM
ncbi:MAG: SDR family NAD(P)-dependent oxidoreductase [Dysgonamonadaceae bacterium]|jgi:short-subunit dehydrogenase|nr:SDR family NAD(P)-dependent oxidoreductase [Dysgonamonadaceae bacterium]